MTAKSLLAAALQRRIDEAGLASHSAAAEQIGITPASLRAVLKQGRRPNRRTFPAYARFLGIDETAVRDLVDPPDELALDGALERRGRPAFALPGRVLERLRALDADELDMIGDFAAWLVRRRPSPGTPVPAPRRRGTSRFRRARRISGL